MEGFSDATVTMDARYAWKYAASRGMTGTPQFLVNGVNVPDAPEYTAAKWGEFIDSLLNTPTTKWWSTTGMPLVPTAVFSAVHYCGDVCRLYCVLSCAAVQYHRWYLYLYISV